MLLRDSRQFVFGHSGRKSLNRERYNCQAPPVVGKPAKDRCINLRETTADAEHLPNRQLLEILGAIFMIWLVAGWSIASWQSRPETGPRDTAAVHGAASTTERARDRSDSPPDRPSRGELELQEQIARAEAFSNRLNEQALRQMQAMIAIIRTIQDAPDVSPSRETDPGNQSESAADSKWHWPWSLKEK
jgi:hypothetical protein